MTKSPTIMFHINILNIIYIKMNEEEDKVLSSMIMTFFNKLMKRYNTLLQENIKLKEQLKNV